MAFDLARATAYLESINLRGTPRGRQSMDAAADAGAIFDKAKDQAQVVGSGLISFQKGVDVTTRSAIADSLLLAQLHANKQVDFEENPESWYKIYGDVLQNVGWTVQDHGFSDYSADGSQAEVNEKILALLTVALGAAPTALAVITASINALKSMAPDNPWITLWSREVQRANMARCQIGVVNTDADGTTNMSLVACILRAQAAISQVLFFKWRDAHASLKASTRQAWLNPSSVTNLGPAIREKIEAYQADYLSSIKDL